MAAEDGTIGANDPAQPGWLLREAVVPYSISI
jgi:hypothetical protein